MPSGAFDRGAAEHLLLARRRSTLKAAPSFGD